MTTDTGHAEILDRLQRELLGPVTELGRREVTQHAGVSLLQARKFWQALGFPLVQDEEAIFTEADREALVLLGAVIRQRGIDESLALAMIRAVARTTDRLAVWQTQLIAEALEVTAGALPDEVPAQAALTMLALSDEIEPLLTYAWRRHLYAALTRMFGDAGPDQAGPVRVVGFADLVGFTALVRKATERELAELVKRFEQLASDIITAHGGRVIKTVGDEVLFVSTEPLAAAAIALELVDALAEDEKLPTVRVGMGMGPVLSRLGDVFGTTVNRASRLSDVATAGTVVVDEPLGTRLGSLSGFTVAEPRRRHLRGLGPVTCFVVTRSRGGRLGASPAPRWLA